MFMRKTVFLGLILTEIGYILALVFLRNNICFIPYPKRMQMDIMGNDMDVSTSVILTALRVGKLVQTEGK